MTWRPDLERIMRSEGETIAAVARVMAGSRESARLEALADGGHIVALGPGRYVNRAVGVGPDLGDADLDHIEKFFETAGLSASVQISSLAGEETLARLAERGYRAGWFRWVMAAKITKTHADAAGPARVVEVDDDLLESWTDVLAAGNDAESGEHRAISDEYADAAHRVESSIDYLAIVDGVPAASGSLEFADGIAWLGGATTVPAFRNRGLQRQLLGHRIRRGRHLGSEIVAATTAPGSVSARNLARMGLKLVDVQTVMTRA